MQVSWEEMPIYNCLTAYGLVMDSMLKDESLLEFFRSKGDCDYNRDGCVDFEDIRHNLFGYMYEWLHRAMAIQTGDYVIREGMVLWALGAMLGNEEMVDEGHGPATGFPPSNSGVHRVRPERLLRRQDSHDRRYGGRRFGDQGAGSARGEKPSGRSRRPVPIY